MNFRNRQSRNANFSFYVQPQLERIVPINTVFCQLPFEKNLCGFNYKLFRNRSIERWIEGQIEFTDSQDVAKREFAEAKNGFFPKPF